MPFDWNKSLSTGVDWQDKQHKELFRRTGRLIEAIEAGRGAKEVLELFDFLDEYFVVHFEAEDQMMHRLNYPDTLSHVSEHTRFIEEIARLREEAASGPSEALSARTRERVIDWLIHHIGSVDKSLGAFIKEAARKTSPKRKQ